jgi:hypothetical protein
MFIVVLYLYFFIYECVGVILDHSLSYRDIALYCTLYFDVHKSEIYFW